jgi:ABC-type Fe3+-hydroxamate transport system substrate-binding protein
MSLNIAKLSEVLDKAAPGRKLAAEIKSQNNRIKQDLATKKVAFIEVDGTNYKIVSTDSIAVTK